MPKINKYLFHEIHSELIPSSSIQFFVKFNLQYIDSVILSTNQSPPLSNQTCIEATSPTIELKPDDESSWYETWAVLSSFKLDHESEKVIMDALCNEVRDVEAELVVVCEVVEVRLSVDIQWVNETVINDPFEVPVWWSALRGIERVGPKEKLSLLEGDSCAICLESFKGDKKQEKKDIEVLLKLPCKHVFHEDCIYSWLIKSGLCPLCRSSVREFR